MLHFQQQIGLEVDFKLKMGFIESFTNLFASTPCCHWSIENSFSRVLTLSCFLHRALVKAALENSDGSKPTLKRLIDDQAKLLNT